MWMPLLNQTNVCPTNSSSLRIRSLPSLLLLVVSELNNTQFWVNFSRSIKPPTWLWNWPLHYFWNCKESTPADCLKSAGVDSLWNCAAIELHSTECGNMGCQVFKGGIQKLGRFLAKINILKGNDFILCRVVQKCQNLTFKAKFLSWK